VQTKVAALKTGGNKVDGFKSVFKNCHVQSFEKKQKKKMINSFKNSDVFSGLCGFVSNF